MKHKITIIFVFVLFISGCSLFNWEHKANELLENHEEELLEVIKLVKEKKLEQDVDFSKGKRPSTLYKVPDEYKYLTDNGIVNVYQNNEDGTQVGFFVFTGILGSSNELMYSSGGQDMIEKNDSQHFVETIKHIKDNWYYVIID